MGKYFGTDGFRGEAGITLTADHAYKVGRFLGWYYSTTTPCVSAMATTNLPVVDCGDGSIWLFELRVPDQPLQPVVLAGSVLSINEHSETILERNLLHSRM